MPKGLGAVPIGLALVGLVGFLYWAERRWPASRRSQPEASARREVYARQAPTFSSSPSMLKSVWA